MDALLRYSQSLVPGVLLAAAFLALLPRSLVELRLVAWILVFVLARDAMTPAGLWKLGGPGFIRLPDSSGLLVALGLSSLAIVLFMQWFEPDLKKLVVWSKGSKPAGIAASVASGIAIALPVFALEAALPPEQKGTRVASELWPALLFFSLVGNLYEEVLFRGYFQGYCEQQMSTLRAALLSGITFGLFHMFLATTVTQTGAIVLVFTVYEGTLCAFLRRQWGVAPAAVAHGLGIFLIATGIL